MMKLWIDDLREPPDEWWHWAKTSADALAVLGCDVCEISFDHDLGGDDTAMPVVRRIEELAYAGEIHPIVWRVHSANPVGRKNLLNYVMKCAPSTRLGTRMIWAGLCVSAKIGCYRPSQ